MKKQLCLIFLVILMFFTSGATISTASEGKPEIVDIPSLSKTTDKYGPASPQSLKAYMTDSAEGMPESIQKVIAWLLKQLEHVARVPVEARLSRSLTYETTDAHGKSQIVSGLITAPNLPKKASFPIVLFQHPTQVERMYSPSHASLNLLDDQLTWFLADLMRIAGFIVLSPDYPGMGVNMDTHPYCHKSIANSVVDMVPAAMKHLAEVAPNIQWNGNIYLIGFSEGGYATMVAAKALQEKQSKSMKIRGVYCLDAPLSLSGTMRDVMLNATTDYDAPYFLPYFIAAYSDTYSKQIPEFRFDHAVRKDVSGYRNFPEYLQSHLNGNYTGSEISAVMMKAKPYEGPKSIMTTQIIEALKNPDSQVSKKLSENNAYEGYKPEPDILTLYHNLYDDYVPVGNSREAAKYFYKVQDQVVSLQEFPWYFDGLGSVHAGAFPVAFGLAFSSMWAREYSKD